MKIIVFGASQGLGKQVVQRGLAHGHTVTAFARHPEKLGISHERLRLVAGDAASASAVTAALKGQRAAVCTLGLPTKQAIGFGRSPVLTAGIANIIEGMERHGVRRLVLETAIGTGESRRALSWAAWLAFRGVLGYQFREKDRQERMVRESDLDWTIVRPSALTNGPLTDRILVDPPQSYGLFTHASRADVAEEIIRIVADSEEFGGRAVTLSYARRGWRDFPRWLGEYR